MSFMRSAESLKHRRVRESQHAHQETSDFERDTFVNLGVSETVESSTEFTENSLKKTKYPVSVRSLGKTLSNVRGQRRTAKLLQADRKGTGSP